jgi:HEAT repeat protein
MASNRRWDQLRKWEKAARSADLEGVETEMGPTMAVTGRSGPLRVRLEEHRRGPMTVAMRITIDGLGHGSPGMTLRREGVRSALAKAVGESEIEVGADSFDREVYVQGPDPLVRAVLGAETRHIVRGLLDGLLRLPGGEIVDVQGALDDGGLRIEVPDRRRGRRDKGLLPAIIREAVAIARRLAAPDDIPGRIAANLRDEPSAGVRLKCLGTLIREFPEHRSTREALLSARQDASDRVRLKASVALGDEGREVLLEIASRKEAEDSCSAASVRALGDGLPRSRCERILRSALEAGRVETATACIEALGRRASPEAVKTLAKVLSEEGDPVRVRSSNCLDACLAAARALGQTGLPAAEAPLIAALGSPAPELRVVAARALGRVGTVAAMPPLQEVAWRMPEGGMRGAARQAVAEIRSRLAGAGPGQLSLAEEDGEAGRLSLAGDESAGRLTLSGEDAPGRAPPSREDDRDGFDPGRSPAGDRPRLPEAG